MHSYKHPRASKSTKTNNINKPFLFCVDLLGSSDVQRLKIPPRKGQRWAANESTNKIAENLFFTSSVLRLPCRRILVMQIDAKWNRLWRQFICTRRTNSGIKMGFQYQNMAPFTKYICTFTEIEANLCPNQMKCVFNSKVEAVIGAFGRLLLC